MATREDLDGWLTDALNALGGSGSIADVCKHVWGLHEDELRSSGNLFYTWQYDIGWAANRLRRRRVMKSAEESPAHVWELAPSRTLSTAAS